jgi:tetratricopeptide (TPR) repeat protein
MRSTTRGTPRAGSKIRHAPKALVVALLLASVARADDASTDVVVLRSPTNARARSRIAGRVVDYTANQVVIETSDGRELTRPGGLVIEIESRWSASQTVGDGHYAQHEYREALAEYDTALRKEQRRWVQRLIVARMVECQREMGRLDAAGARFLILVRDDPDTPYFDAIPLTWLAGEPSPALEQAARQWLKGDSPVANLLGASHLLSTASRPAAVERLERLALDKDDPRVATLAQAQLWRARWVNAGDDQLARWAAMIEQFPESLRPGPYMVLGRALAQRDRTLPAALAMLRVAVLFPRQRTLVADALWEAGRLLEKLGQTAGAETLYQELTGGFGENLAAAGARSRLQELKIDEKPAAAPITPRGDTFDERFLDGLRQRRLFELAEGWCRTQLEGVEAAGTKRLGLAIELSRNFAEHALESPPAERDALWRQALAAVADFPLDESAFPKRILLHVQTGLVHVVRGELLRQEAEVVAAGEERLEQARDALRDAIAALRADAEKVAVALRRATPAKKTAPGQFTTDDLGELQRNVNFQLARALRNQGQSYPAGSADRTNSLRQAVELLAHLAQSDDDDDVAWHSRLDEIACDRLLEDQDAAKQRLALLAQRNPPPRIVLAARAEEVRLALDGGPLAEALAVADVGRTIAGESSPELDFALLEAYVTAWKAAAGDERRDLAETYQARAAEMVQEIDRLYSPYWGRRAETVLAGGVSATGGADDLVLLTRAAESFYRSGEIDEALAAYARVAEQAVASGQGDAAFEAGYTIAAIEQARGRHDVAASVFRRLALESPRHAKADKAHLLAIYNTSQAAKGDDVGQSEYRRLLDENLAHWPNADGAGQVRVWLGKLDEREHQWSDALAVYRRVLPERPQFAEAVEGRLRCQRALLAELAAAGKTPREAAAEAAGEFERLVTGTADTLPERFSDAQRVAALGAAELWAAFAVDHADRAERLLRAALERSEEAPQAWRSSATCLLVLALAAQGQRDEARRLLDDAAWADTEQLRLLAAGLRRMATGASPAVARELVELELRAGELVRARRDEQSGTAPKRIDLEYVAALAQAGKRDEALSAVEQLAREFPRDGRIQEAHAQLLLDGTTASDWRVAAEKWHTIEARSKRPSERWFRAIYAQALAQKRLGKPKQTVKMIKLTEAMHPELGGPEMKARFLELLEEAKR